MKEIFEAIRNFLKDRFNLDEDRAGEQEIVANIHRDVVFKGTNLWTLIFAILIASIGLNLNSTAVVIGAMLISPLMGPLMGIGLAIGTNDFDLLKHSVKNLAIASVISIITSSLYFSITPLHDANSELLARTTPSVWDVFIAIFGGFAGIIAGTRTIKSNVIPGVAIATAIMPPLCTAGYGIANGKWMFSLGALYLYFINCLFICLAAFVIVKKLCFHKKEFQSKDVERRVLRYIWLSVTVTILPSIYLAYRIVERSIFESNAKAYVQKEFNFSRTQVVTRKFVIAGNKRTIELLLVGQELPGHTIDSLEHRLTLYGLDSAKLVVRQGLNASQQFDFAEIKASILQDVIARENAGDTTRRDMNKLDLPIPDLRTELKTLYPSLQNYSLAQTPLYNLDSSRVDTLSLLTASFKQRMPLSERQKLQQWVKQRIHSDSVKLVVE